MAARPSTSPASAFPRLAMSCRRESRLATCLYSDGWRTPRRAAGGARGGWAGPTSSASSAAAATTRSVCSPALGTSGVRLEEGEHEPNHLVGELVVRVVPGNLDHLKAAEAGRQGSNDRRALGVRVGPVGAERAHHDQDRAADVAELRACVCRGARSEEHTSEL